MPDEIADGEQVLVVNAVDSLDYGVNAAISYSVVGGNGSSLFDVESHNGTVYVKSTLRGHTGQYRTVNVRATDHGSPSMASTVAVTMLVTQRNRYAPTVSIRYL